MISEVDLRDWDKVDFKLFERAEKISPYDYSMFYFAQFVEQVRELHQKQINTVPALLRKQ